MYIGRGRWPSTKIGSRFLVRERTRERLRARLRLLRGRGAIECASLIQNREIARQESCQKAAADSDRRAVLRALARQYAHCPTFRQEAKPFFRGIPVSWVSCFLHRTTPLLH